MWIYDPQTLLVMAVNDAALQCYGYSRAEFLSLSVSRLYLTEELRLPDSAVSLESAKGLRESRRHVRSDGVVLFMELVRWPLMLNGASACLVSAEDVSASRKASLLYSMLMDSIPSSALLIDENLRVVSANRNFFEKSRQKEGETSGKRLRDVFPEVILVEMGLETQIRNVFRSGKAMSGQKLSFRAPGVPIRVYYCRIMPVDLAGRVDHVLLLVDDVTEQSQMGVEIRRMERHLASVVESATDIVVSTDVRGNILSWNQAAETVTGYTLEELKGKAFFDYCDESQAAVVRRMFSDHTSSMKPGRTECDLRSKSGSFHPVALVVSRMTDDGANAAGFVIVGRDLTEQRQFELQLLESQKLAALGVMARGIAHEIRTPLAIASSAAQFLMEDDITPEFSLECAQKVNSGINRASAIIENLLRFAHPSVQKTKVAVDLVSVVCDALTLVDNQARVQKVEMVNLCGPKPSFILGVANLLEQVFINLFLNAIKAMPNGGTLQVSSERTTTDLMVRVIDSGEGIEADDIDKIFDPFYTKSPPGKGTGLGLSICYSIIDQHKGTIRADSSPGKGTTFTVKLPLLPAKKTPRP